MHITIVKVKKCDEPSCNKTIVESSKEKIEILGKDFFLNIDSFSAKYSRLDFCNKTCMKKFVDNVNVEEIKE